MIQTEQTSLYVDRLENTGVLRYIYCVAINTFLHIVITVKPRSGVKVNRSLSWYFYFPGPLHEHYTINYQEKTVDILLIVDILFNVTNSKAPVAR